MPQCNSQHPLKQTKTIKQDDILTFILWSWRHQIWGAYGKFCSCLMAFLNSKSHMTNVAKHSKNVRGAGKQPDLIMNAAQFPAKTASRALSHTHFLLHTAHDNRQMIHTNIYTRKCSKQTYAYTSTFGMRVCPNFWRVIVKALTSTSDDTLDFSTPGLVKHLKTCRINSKIHNSLFFPFLKEGLS